jgi:peptidase M28-like protein
MIRKMALLSVAVLSCTKARPEPRPSTAFITDHASRWWEDVRALADDSVRGRDTGSPEHRKAADFVAGAFRDAGLTAGGTQDYLQPVAFVARSVDESRSRLTLIRDGKEQTLTLGEDAILMPRAPLAPALEAPVVFVGYGLDLPEYGHDDLRGLDLKGKVVAYVTGNPKGIPGPVLSHARNQAWPTFRAAGAVGMIAFSVARTDSGFRRAVSNRGTPAFALADQSIDPQAGNQLSVQFNTARAEKLFAGTPGLFVALIARADSGLALPQVTLGVRIRSAVRLNERSIGSENVIGILPGVDPALRKEYVVLTAHLDHLGVGRPVNGDSIYNGAMDNASGTALLMDLARHLAASHGSLRRSVVFVVVTGEEKGLLGSRFFANHPTVPLDAIVADLNTDMFLPIIPFTMIMVNGLEESDLAADARHAGRIVGIKVVTDPEPEENRFVRSDQYSFILRGVPALSLKVGFARDTPEHQAVKEFRSKRYHMPSDDVRQPVNLETAAGFEGYFLTLVQQVANRASRPSWDARSYFRRFARTASQ